MYESLTARSQKLDTTPLLQAFQFSYHWHSGFPSQAVVARKRSGKPYNHVKEVAEAQTRLTSIIKDIKKKLSEARLPDSTRKSLQRELGEASRLLDHSAKFVPKGSK